MAIETRYIGNRFSTDMTLEKAASETTSWLKKLDQEGRLLTRSEAEDLEKLPFTPYRRARGVGLDRLLGAEILAKHIEALGLTYPKVPRSVVVLDDGIEEFKFEAYASRIGQPQIHSWKVNVLFEECDSDPDYTMTREQSLELFQLIHTSGYFDMHTSNIYISESGAYVVDTELRNHEFRGCTNPKFAWRFPIESLHLRELIHKHPVQTSREPSGLPFWFKRRPETFTVALKDVRS